MHLHRICAVVKGADVVPKPRSSLVCLAAPEQVNQPEVKTERTISWGQEYGGFRRYMPHAIFHRTRHAPFGLFAARRASTQPFLCHSGHSSFGGPGSTPVSTSFLKKAS